MFSVIDCRTISHFIRSYSLFVRLVIIKYLLNFAIHIDCTCILLNVIYVQEINQGGISLLMLQLRQKMKALNTNL